MTKQLLGALAFLVTLGFAATGAADTIPSDWAVRDDSTLVHAPSGALCPLEIASFKRVGIESKGPPDLGICTYAGEQDLGGLIRVRQYVRGAGETPLAAQNDQMLIEPPAGSPKIVMGLRAGPGPDKNGAPTQQSVITVARKGLLIDCIGRQLQRDRSNGAFDFALACKKQQTE